MQKIINSLLKNRKFVIIIFCIITAIFGILSLATNVNYDLYDYLPKESNSIIALDIDEENFDEELPNLNALIAINDVSEVSKYRTKFENINGVSNINSLDDVIDIKTPIDFYSEEDYSDYYKQNVSFDKHKDVNAVLFKMFVSEENKKTSIESVEKIIGDNGTVTGSIIEDQGLANSSSKNSMMALLLLIPVIFLVLFFITRSFFAPLLVFITIGIAVLINMGTNIFIPDVSFVTNTVAPVLQFAVSLDYSIFLLFSFKKYQEESLNKNIDEDIVSMGKAIKDSFPVIISCGLTTCFGFIALCFMKFSIGANLGLAISKGIFFSMVSVLLFFPCAVLVFQKLIAKTEVKFKKRLNFNIGKYILKFRFVIFILVILIIPTSFLASKKVDFEYGAETVAMTPEIKKNTDELNEIFPQSDTMIIFVKSGDEKAEYSLTKKLEKMDWTDEVISYQNSVGEDIPKEMLSEKIVKNFYSNGWTRIILYYDSSMQKDNSYSIVKDVKKIVHSYYEKDYYISGSEPVVSDLKNVTNNDNFMVNIIAILSIFLIVLIMFRSIIMPVILVLTIETAIWVNFSIPYFSGNSFMFIGYLIISSVLLGACVDYAILFSKKYLDERKRLLKKDAIIKMVNENYIAIFLSAIILTAAGFGLAVSTNNEMVRQLGILIGRGAVFAFLFVFLFLPVALYFFDVLIKKLSVGYSFRREKNENK